MNTATPISLISKLIFFSPLFILAACTETIPVKPFEAPVSLPGHLTCQVELGGYFRQDYGRKNQGDRATAKLQFTIPESAFIDRQSDSKVRTYALADEADNRIIFLIDGKTQAGADLTSVQIRDGSRNDSIEFNVDSASGRIGYVEQNKNSLFVRLSDSAGVVLSAPNDKADKDRDWSGFIDAKQSEIHLTDDTYRKRALQTEPFTIDAIEKSCQ